MQYDDAVLQCFLENQEQLFPEGDVVSSLEEAEEFLEENFAVVVNSLREVWDFFEEEGIDMDGADEDEILNADEVFGTDEAAYANYYDKNVLQVIKNAVHWAYNPNKVVMDCWQQVVPAEKIEGYDPSKA